MTCIELSQEGGGRLWPGLFGSSWLFLPNGKNWGRSIHLLNPRSGQHRGLHPASQKLSRAVAKSNALEAERPGFKSGPATSHLRAGHFLSQMLSFLSRGAVWRVGVWSPSRVPGGTQKTLHVAIFMSVRLALEPRFKHRRMLPLSGAGVMDTFPQVNKIWV